MTEILNDPHVKRAVANELVRDEVAGVIADQLMSTKTWWDMTADEHKICPRAIVSPVESEEELEGRLRADLGLKLFATHWYLPEPGDKKGDEARILVKAMGGLVSKNGALVMIRTSEDTF